MTLPAIDPSSCPGCGQPEKDCTCPADLEELITTGLERLPGEIDRIAAAIEAALAKLPDQCPRCGNDWPNCTCFDWSQGLPPELARRSTLIPDPDLLQLQINLDPGSEDGDQITLREIWPDDLDPEDHQIQPADGWCPECGEPTQGSDGDAWCTNCGWDVLAGLETIVDPEDGD